MDYCAIRISDRKGQQNRSNDGIFFQNETVYFFSILPRNNRQQCNNIINKLLEIFTFVNVVVLHCFWFYIKRPVDVQ